MPPEERRAAIIDATRPLIVRYGADISTRQIAEACALAEGTLFRVFPNKDAIIHTCVREILDPRHVVAAIEGIDRTLPLYDQVALAVGLLHEAGRELAGIVAVLHASRPEGRPPIRSGHHGPEGRQVWKEREEAPDRALAELLAPHENELHTTVPVAVGFIRGIVFAAIHPMAGAGALDATVLSPLVCRALIKEQ